MIIIQQQLCWISDVANPIEQYAVFALLAISTFIFVLLIYRLYLIIRYQYGKQISIVHKLLFFWSFFLNANYILNLISYQLINKQYGSQNYELPQLVKQILPKAMYIASYSTTIILQTTLIIVPYYWIANIIQYIVYIENRNVNKERYLNKIIKFYGIITRIAFIAALTFLILANQKLVFKISQVMMYSVIIQAFICAIIIFIGSRILLVNFKRLAQTEDQQIKKMNRQSWLLIFACIVRGLFDSFSVRFFDHLRKFQKVSGRDICLQQPQNYNYCIFLILEMLLMHFLPTLILLTIYSLNEKNSRGTVNRSMLSSSLIQQN